MLHRRNSLLTQNAEHIDKLSINPKEKSTIPVPLLKEKAIYCYFV